MRRIPYTYLALYFVILTIFVAVRFWRLGDSCLWFDEMFSVQASEQPWADMFRFVALDLVHPPLFYILLKVWISIGGDGVVWVRSLPVIFACLSVVPFLLLCRELKQTLAATALSLFLIACNGSLIKYAQEVRMYTMLMFLSLCSMWLFARYFYRGKSFVALLLVNLITVYLHYFGWAVIGCEVFAILIFQRVKWRPIALMAGIVLAAFLPWAYIVVQTAKEGHLGENIEWIRRPGVRVLFDYCFDLIEPFYFQVSSAEPASIYIITIPLLLIILTSVGVFAANRRNEQGEVPFVGFLLVFSAATLTAVFAASWLLPYSVWGTRHLIIIVAPMLLLMANALTRFSTRNLRTAVLTFVLLLCGYSGYSMVARESPQYVWCGWANLITEAPLAGDQTFPPVKVYTSENLAAYHAWFTTRRESQRFRIFTVKAPEGEFIDREYFPPRGFDGVNWAKIDEITDEHIVLLYRIEQPNLTDWLRLRIEEKGYTACLPSSLTYGVSTIVRVEMTKNPGTCRSID